MASVAGIFAAYGLPIGLTAIVTGLALLVVGLTGLFGAVRDDRADKPELSDPPDRILRIELSEFQHEDPGLDIHDPGRQRRRVTAPITK
jgi:hypothetical protein